MDQLTIVSLIGVICSIVVGVVSYIVGTKKKSKQEGKEQGSMESNIKNLEANTTYIMRRMDESLLEQKETNRSLNTLSERVTRVEESTKSAHKRIDDLERDGK
ncbi:hypothetical protein [Desulfosporosinus sp. FKA]|uniref:hypothetical protein n=1 Tax=Desulfosporosinus sp. FKA TaxID=1969834 RepID=UPI000B4A4E33|nr:hypothetical protein [Desulfosporosinus sp. FKA]